MTFIPLSLRLHPSPLFSSSATFISITLLRLPTCVSICSSFILLLLSLHICLCWINMQYSTSSCACVKLGVFFFFPKKPPLLVCPCHIRALEKTLTSTCLCNTWSLSVYVCLLHLSIKGWDMFCLWHMPHPDWLSLLFLSSPQPSKPSWRKGVPGVHCDLSAPEGGFAKQKGALELLNRR